METLEKPLRHELLRDRSLQLARLNTPTRQLRAGALYAHDHLQVGPSNVNAGSTARRAPNRAAGQPPPNQLGRPGKLSRPTGRRTNKGETQVARVTRRRRS